MNRVLGIVPARGGSKRLVGKNARLLGGRPLISWAVAAASSATSLHRVVLSSDDTALLSFAEGRVTALRRPAEMAADKSEAIEFVRHALVTLETAGEPPFDAVVIVQPTSPFTLPADIDAVVDLLERSGAESAVSVQELEHALNPAKLKRLDGDRLRPYLEEERGRMSAHQLEKVYIRNGSVYASRRSTLEANSILGDDSRGYLMPRERSIDINDELDLAFAEFLLARASASTQ